MLFNPLNHWASPIVFVPCVPKRMAFFAFVSATENWKQGLFVTNILYCTWTNISPHWLPKDIQDLKRQKWLFASIKCWKEPRKAIIFGHYGLCPSMGMLFGLKTMHWFFKALWTSLSLLLDGISHWFTSTISKSFHCSQAKTSNIYHRNWRHLSTLAWLII